MKRKNKFNAGFTYVELIVVLSIFAVMTSIVIFNYGAFEAKVDINNYANDIALQIVQAQKTAMSGEWPSSLTPVSPWKPAYGIYFPAASSGSPLQNFIYYADLNNSILSGLNGYSGTNENLTPVTMNKGIYVSDIESEFTDGTKNSLLSNGLDITFTRPSSTPVIYSGGMNITQQTNFSYVQITITSPQGISANIELYSSGRVQIN